MRKNILTAAALLMALALSACTTTPLPTSSLDGSSPVNGTSTTSSLPAIISSSMQPSLSSSSSSHVAEMETVIKEYYPAMYSDRTFAKTPENVALDDMIMLVGTSNATDGSKEVVLPDGETTIDGRTSLPKGGRFKLEGRAEKKDEIPVKKAIKFTSGGEGKLLIAAISANSSDNTRTLTFADENGVELQTSAGLDGTSVTFCTFDIPARGDYYLYSNINGINCYYFKLTASVEKGIENGFSIDADACRKVFLAGETLDTTGLVVKAEFSNGNSVVLKDDEYAVVSDYRTVAGSYTVTVTYKDYEALTYAVQSYDAVELKVLTMGSVNYSDDAKLVYQVGDILDLSKLVVKAVLDNKTRDELILKASAYTLDTSGVDMNTVGNYYARLSYGSLNPINIPITVAGAITKIDGIAKLAVDGQTTTDGTTVDDVLTFKTLKGALQYLRSLKVIEPVEITVKEGIYNERVEIDLPNITLRGVSNPTIVYDAASGATDIRGVSYGTQGSATFAVDSRAVGFKAHGIKFVNSFDYANSTLGDKQAVAVVNEADQSIFEDCVFTSFQDTLYAKYGRQYYKNCSIEGAIDFIFGNNAPALFENCVIHSLNRDDQENGGYITATKGTNSGNDVPTYGYVFKSCRFTAEEGVVNGTVSLGRPWGKDATVAVIDSTLGAHISLKGYGDKSDQKNARYESMSGNVPTNAHYVEYNNTGEGAIESAVAGVTLLTTDQYASYTAANIFKAVNGNLSFTSDWTV